jgi:16S rRNA (guanine527-N7)-methyltransferase
MEILLKYFSDFTPEQVTQFAALEDLYRDWNSKINVISRRDIDSLYEKHVLHSLAIAAIFDFPPGTEIIDIGTGGGFPGIPLAIYFPEVRFHLVDSIGKKLKVIEAVAEAVGLKNVTVQHTRAEEIRDRKFDFAVSRAVSSLKDLIRWSKPVLKPAAQKVPSADGTELYKPGLICLKGGALQAEINESATKPKQIALDDLFEEDFFKEKYLLYV